MEDFSKVIKQHKLSTEEVEKFKLRFVGCLIVTQDGKILLQKRGDTWDHLPGYISGFGGRIESGENEMMTLIRELNEELGANVSESDVVKLGDITEAVTNYTELTHEFFWHDKNGSITGCYEGEAIYFDDLKDVHQNSKVMDDVRWMLQECQEKGLIK